jgi:hypothetical protein
MIAMRKTLLRKHTREDTLQQWDETRATLVRATAFSPSSPILGWITAWGAAIVAVSCLRSAGVDLGLGFGIADAVGQNNGFAAGLWLALVQAGAFMIGGYAAARIARRNGTRHALLAWLIAMIATGADAIISAIRDRAQVIADLGLPYWNNTGLESSGSAFLALALFALFALAGAFVGGLMGQTANLAARKRAERDLQPAMEGSDSPVVPQDRRDDTQTIEEGPHDSRGLRPSAEGDEVAQRQDDHGTRNGRSTSDPGDGHPPGTVADPLPATETSGRNLGDQPSVREDDRGDAAKPKGFDLSREDEPSRRT